LKKIECAVKYRSRTDQRPYFFATDAQITQIEGLKFKNNPINFFNLRNLRICGRAPQAQLKTFVQKK